MRWMWIDRVLKLEPGRRLVAIKNVSLAEDHLHDHFAADEARGLRAEPIMPASLIIEGMAQSAGVLVGHAGGFAQKVVLAKIGRVELRAEARPGVTLRYTAEIERMDEQGAATKGTVEMLDHARPGSGFVEIGTIELMFSHLDNSMGARASGAANEAIPSDNFVFGDGFKTLLRSSGIEM